jgi:hypothetical protein
MKDGRKVGVLFAKMISEKEFPSSSVIKGRVTSLAFR